mmetsp:Transcript_15606/g.56057  ORF Transcript_15606/g.56057 Transcript_15606/m.56057 type:complete len:341 (+) Transcript_15606:1347-2369(+)
MLITARPRQSLQPLALARRAVALVLRRRLPRSALMLARPVAPLRLAIDPVVRHRERVFEVQRRDRVRAAGERHARGVVEVFREDVAVHRGGHQAELHRRRRGRGGRGGGFEGLRDGFQRPQRRRALRGVVVVAVALLRFLLKRPAALAPLVRAPPEHLLERHEKEIALHRALVHLVHEHVRHAVKPRVSLQPPQQHPRRAKQQPRVIARLALAADRVPDRADADARLSALARDALGDADGGDPPRLRADDVHRRARLRGVLQQVLRHLRRLPAPGLALHDRHRVVLERVYERVSVAVHREAHPRPRVRAAAGHRRRRAHSKVMPAAAAVHQRRVLRRALL